MTCYFFRCLIMAVSIIFGATGLSGCIQSPQKPSTQHISTTASREKLALDLQGRGELAGALIQWTILSNIDPDNEFYKKQVDAVTKLIDVKSKSLIREGVASLRRGASEAARLSFLKTLAVDPKNKEAFEYLQQLARMSPRGGQNSRKADNECCGSGSSMPE
jgi:tetratricopeptide (TPR) repeat protein